MTNSISRTKAIFGQAIEIEPGPARMDFLDQACAGNPEMRAEVEDLLRSLEGAGDFLKHRVPAVALLASSDIVDGPGTVIGRYKLLEQIGDGGMGVVFMADQQDPVRRRVALKIIKPGMDTRQVIARFEAERQALALMDHPNIARGLDAGVTDSGRPFFVMELVRGIPITDYADQNSLGIPARLQLFVDVCHAVQHAHQNGIIHRDLKPSNVLVTTHDGRAVPKVIDFGVAKATCGQLTDKTLFTNFSQMIGTPSYMSPEQAEMSGLDVDTRSDIYSLGVLLYELLTGKTPFDKTRLREASYDEMRRIIRDEEPLAPSAFVHTLGQATTSLAAQRRVDPASFPRLLCGDLDWIVIKALEKDRGHRYPTANDLARDIERHLGDEPVEARPPSAVYRFQKFARRNRPAIITTTLVAAALVAGTVTSTWQAVRARQAEAIAETERNEAQLQRHRAEAERNEAESQRRRAEASFQKARLALDQYVASARDNKLLDESNNQSLRRELVETTSAYYRHFIEQYHDDPALAPELAMAYIHIGQISDQIGSKAQACEAFQKGAQLYERLCQTAPENRDYEFRLADTLSDLAKVQRDMGRDDAGRDHAGRGASAQSSARALAIFERLFRDDPDDTRNMTGLANALCHDVDERTARNESAGAESSVRRAIGLYEEYLRQYPRDGFQRAALGHAHSSLARLQQASHRPEDATASFRHAVEVYEGLILDFPSVTAYRKKAALAEVDLGDEYHRLGRGTESSSAFEQARAAFQVVGRQDPTNPTGRMGMGRVHFRMGLLQAESGDNAAAQRSWSAAATEFAAAAHMGYAPANSYGGLAAACAMQGRWADAADAYGRVVQASGRACRALTELALLQLVSGNVAGYRATCTELVARFGNGEPGDDTVGLLTACVAGDTAKSELASVLAVAERLAATDPPKPLHQALLGAAQIRAGQLPQGRAILGQALPRFDTTEQTEPGARDQLRALRLIATTVLARTSRQTNDEPAHAAQLDSLRRLITAYETALPRHDDQSPRWLLGVSLQLARDETTRLEQVPQSLDANGP